MMIAQHFRELIYKATRPERPFDYVVVSFTVAVQPRHAPLSRIYSRRLHKAGVRLVFDHPETSARTAPATSCGKILNVFDEHQSRENAKHVHRAMLENARQGYWNGGAPALWLRT